MVLIQALYLRFTTQAPGDTWGAIEAALPGAVTVSCSADNDPLDIFHIPGTSVGVCHGCYCFGAAVRAGQYYAHWRLLESKRHVALLSAQATRPLPRP